MEIRRLTTLEGFDQCVALEEAVWGYDPADMIPRRMFLLASRIGGQVLGAYEGDEAVGFAMALPAYRDGMAYLHSHMVGVLPAWRNKGVARALKLAQRDDALARGIALMEWTFDPLEIKNAHLNVARLGCVVRRYQRDFYGPSSSPLQGGLPTDRVYAEWWLRSERVERAVRGDSLLNSAEESIEVPAEISQWKSEPATRKLAHEIQSRNAFAFEEAFRRGLSVVGYTCDERGDGRFLLGSLLEANTQTEHEESPK